jgi:hypothetical protein
MNKQAIDQLAQAIDLTFGRPGSSSIALANLELIKALADALVAFEQAQKQTQAEAEIDG